MRVSIELVEFLMSVCNEKGCFYCPTYTVVTLACTYGNDDVVPLSVLSHIYKQA